MARDNPSRLRCLAQIATLGGFAQPGVSGAKYRLTLGLIEDEEGSPIDGTIETQLDDFDDRLEQALVDATKIWIEFDAVETEMHSPHGSGAASSEQRLRVLRADNIEIRWDEAARQRAECPRCDGNGQIDLTVGPRRIVVCKLCGGIGTILPQQQ